MRTIVFSALLLAAFLLPPSGGAAAQEAGLDLLLTRAERTDFRETTRYGEVMELVRHVADASPDIHLATFGYSYEGRPLPLVVVGAPDASPEAVRATGKTRIYVQGDIHAGEVCGKEALLMLLRRFLSGSYPTWTDSLVLLVAPIYNADGNERVALDHRPRQNGPVGGMGTRANAQGLDLNRDHMKLDSPEARSLVGMMNAYDPHVIVDLHTTNGTRHAYHLTYAAPLHPNTPGDITGFLKGRWLPEVTQRIKEKYGWDYYYYGNAYEGPYGMGWYTFDHRPRFNNNYAGLRNRFGILSEAYAYASFEDRVRGTLWFVEELLDFAEQHASRIREITARADLEPVVGAPLAVRARLREAADEVTILLGEVDEARNPYTGGVILQRRDVRIPTRMPEFGVFEGMESETVPAAYYILPEADEAIERVEAHGITVVRYAAAREVPADIFEVDSTAVAERAFQGRHQRTVWGRWVPSVVELPPGTAYVSVDQPLGRLAFSLLEPRSDDGLVAWGFFDAALEEGRLPVMRVPGR
ncbi:MAG: M14 family metallopeptidase [Gemmatimonadota bacterium]